MTSTQEQQKIDTYDPPFNSPNADVILRSAEGTKYRVPSYTLRSTCSYFRQLLPRATAGEALLTDVKEHLFEIDESNEVLERVLRMICGLETPRWETFDELNNAVRLVEFFDAPGPLSIIRGACTSPVFLDEPIKLYGVAMRYGWEEEAKLASKYTLTFSLYDKKYESQLETLGAKDLMVLFSFHRRRRDEFKRAIDGDMFNAGNASKYYCSKCGEEVDNHTWRELKARMFLEIDKRPLGDTLYGLDMEEWPEAVACWNACCKKENCGSPYYNKLFTLRDIKSCVDKLPETI